jgi:hypothetical protein
MAVLSLIGVLVAGVLSGPARASEPPDLTGTWRVELELTNEVKVPILGPARLRSRQIMQATVERRPDGSLIQHHEACLVETLAEQQIVTTHFPPRFVAALPKKSYPLRLTESEGGGWSYFADLKPQHLGYDPARSPEGLPRELDHPALVDGDLDGNPGVTAIARAPVFGEVELYLVQAGHTHLRGRVVSADRVEGAAPMVMLDQWMVGSTNRLFHRNPEVTHRPDLSTFIMDRKPAGTTCADILAADVAQAERPSRGGLGGRR